MPIDPKPIRSISFVAKTREAYRQYADAGIDAVIFDLEDPIPESNRQRDRDFVRELLKDNDAEVRLRAIFMVWETDAEPEGTLPDLEKLLHDPDKRVRISAAGMVGRQDSKRSMAMLALAREALKDADVAVRERALSAIYQLLPQNEGAGRAALPDLLAFLRDHKRQPKKLVQQILWNLSKLEPDANDCSSLNPFG